MSMTTYIAIEKFFRETRMVYCRLHRHKECTDFIRKCNYKKSKIMWRFNHRYVNELKNCGKYHK